MMPLACAPEVKKARAAKVAPATKPVNLDFILQPLVRSRTGIRNAKFTSLKSEKCIAD